MKKLEKTKFFVTAIFALAILLASCDNTAGGAKNPATDNGQGDSPKSVLDTPQTALRNIPLTGELINQALRKTPSNPPLRSASAFDDVKDGLEDDIYYPFGSPTEIMMAILKFDFSKMNLRFGDMYRVPSDFDFSQETCNYLLNNRGAGDVNLLFDSIRNSLRNAFFQIVKYSPTIVYCYFKLNGTNIGALVKLSENITGILDIEYFDSDRARNEYSYERLVESNGKKIIDYRRISDAVGFEQFEKTIIDSINSYYAHYGYDAWGYRFNFRNKSSGFRQGKSNVIGYYVTSGKAVLERHFWEGNWKNNYFLKYLTPIKAGLKLDGDTWKWGDTPATEIQFTDNADGKKVYYVAESDLAGNFSVPESTKNIITTLDAKFAEMETEASRPGFFLTEIPNEADWKKQLDDWLATL